MDSVGGVEMDIPQDIKDKNSGADFKKGKQTLDGKQALAFVRNRHAGTGDSDLGRTKNQQKFLAALASQTATPATVLNPFKLYPTMGAGLDTLVVDEDMSLLNLGSMFFAMKDVSGGEGKRMNMPDLRAAGPRGLAAVGQAEGQGAGAAAQGRREGHGRSRAVSRCAAEAAPQSQTHKQNGCPAGSR